MIAGDQTRRHLPALLPALRHGLARPMLVCAIATGVYQAAFLYSTARTGAALATVVALGTAPVATGLIAWAVCGEHLTRMWMVSTAAAVTGCALLLAPTGTGVDAPGLLAATVSGVCYGLYTVYAKRLATDHPDVHLPTVSALSLLLGAVPLVPWMAAGSAALGQPATLGLIAWLGLATTALPYGLFSIGITSTSAVAVGTLSLAEPLAASFLGVFVLHEHLTATAALGSLLMLGGLAAACLPSARTRPATRPSGQSAAPSAVPCRRQDTPLPRPRPQVAAASPHEPASGDVSTGLATPCLCERCVPLLSSALSAVTDGAAKNNTPAVDG
ncbi:EamA family transporter [Streptomyces flaveolus]|uniref:EamA family transporter n=1 Tax=Streptomyces flaveolus TaxID=67297 RepID=UPI0034410E38